MAAPTKKESFSLQLVIFSFLVIHIAGKAKYVSISLDAKWSSTPYILEASEYVAKENQESFWQFVNDVAKVDAATISEASDEDYYTFVSQEVAKFLSPMQLDLFRLSLSLREYSPVVEMFNQIAKDVQPPADCDAFVVIGHKKTCDHSKIAAWVEKAKSLDLPATTVYEFDHVYPGSDDSAFVVVLYAELGTEQFKSFHATLRQLSHDKKIRYVLRHYVRTPSDTKVRLSGYGVELDIKSTEYKAKDDTKVTDEQQGDESEEEEDEEVAGFIFHKLREKYPDMKAELKEFRTHLMDSATELTPLKAWQYQDLSFQAAQRILSEAPEMALSTLRDISQNFPVLARSLIKLRVDDKLKEEIRRNQKEFESQHNIGDGESALYINGLPIEMDVYDMFTLMDLLKSEGTLMEGLFSLGINGTALSEILRLDVSPKENYALDIRTSAIHYLNDLESDRMYQAWPQSLQDLLRPQFPGMLRHVAKNIFHLVFILDPTAPTGRELLKTAETFFIHSAPIRIGVVFVAARDREVDAKNDASVAASRAFCYISMDTKPSKAVNFFTELYDGGHDDITADVIIEAFRKQYPDEDIDNVFGDNDEYDDCRKLSRDFIEQTGLSDFPQVLMNGVSLKKDSLGEERFEEAVITAILEATPVVQKAVYHGELTDRMSVVDWLMDQDHVLQRLNSRVLSPAKRQLDFTQQIDEEIFNDADTFATLGSSDMTAVMAANMKYIYKKAEQESTPTVTLWVVVDLETPRGRQLLAAALKRLKSSIDLRIGIVFNPSSTNREQHRIGDAVYVAMRDVEVNLAKNFINKLLRVENSQGVRDGAIKLRDLAVNGMDVGAYVTATKTLSTTYLNVHRQFALNVLKFEPGEQGIVANGKVIGPFADNEDFTVEDFELLEKFTSQSSSSAILKRLKSLGHRADLSDLVMKVGSSLANKAQKEKRSNLKFVGDKHSVLKIPAKPNLPAYVVDVIVDPASHAAQKLAPILSVLREVVNIDLRIFMNCRDQLSDLPIKRFYRYVLEPGPVFKNGVQSVGPYAKFVDIPHKSLLTLKMNAPESWLVEAVRSPYDLDNILLDEVEHGVVGEFELEYLLLEGHCSDSSSGQPPRGLQFTLGTNSSPAIVDTIVMANLGYFQLKANPGAWILRLREGRSKDIYDIVSHELTDTPANSSDVIVVINSFKSRIVRMKVEKRPDKRGEDLLKDDSQSAPAPASLWDSISSSFGGSKPKTKDPDSTLNIFSLASGHLYERFLRIMMLSVMKQTKSNVKFWFLKNFLSPTFKNFIPHMAEKYGFQYELVQYKWPRWLHQQTVKQRIIWGYKILFLDVLFPLDVKKFIFVDADQMVRTDLQELFDLDLGGAPYGYTPFCDSRSEMDGFRFWNSGYWRSHLGGRRYHISALYVVDLQKFRHIAAGDRLRGQYQGLSQDPNSLSNLDQDLPNNMIHQVAIKSLPQEWLWCETWCSDESKAYAKTIDLCNNPLTKEPKLQAAMRILPEWKHYDYEIKLLWDSVYNTETAKNTEYDIPETETREPTGVREEL